MSDGSESNPNKIQTEPLKKIGAQDLLKVDYKICGHLRKQGKLNRLLGSKKWSLKFIIVSQGCVYCFRDEHADHPVSAFSLCIYENVVELDSASCPHSFEILPEEKGKGSHIFACETDEKRKEWILCIEEVLQQCRTFLGKLSSDSGIDAGLPCRKSEKRNLPPLPSIPVPSSSGKPKKYKEAKSEYDLESEEEDEPGSADQLDAYDDVDLPHEPAPSPPKAASLKDTRVQVLPVPPDLKKLTLNRNRPQTISDRPPVPVPVSRSYMNNTIFTETEYTFDSNNRDEAMQLMRPKPEGTFLIRNARSGPGKVLTVMTEIGIKEFQITEKGSKVSLDNKEFFPAIDAMLTFYNQNNLPKSEYQTKLLRGYKSKP